MATKRKPVILYSTIQFVTVGSVVQIIGRDILTSQDVTLATIDNRLFKKSWFTSDWTKTAKMLNFSLIGSPQQFNPPPKRHDKASREILGALLSAAILAAILASGVLK